MKLYKKITALLPAIALCVGTFISPAAVRGQEADDAKVYIEETLNLANNEEQEWTYSGDSDAWTLSVVSAVAYPELPDQQGVSVCVPGNYVKGIDTDGDGAEDVTKDEASESVKGALVIDYDSEVTSASGQVYTASSAPVILNTGAAGYSSQKNSEASAEYAADGYINVACGNRGKQDILTDEDGNTVYTGDAPSCLADQKAAARYVKYNILLGNLPGNTDCFVSTGGSGGGAHAVMFAATSNNQDFYDYQIEAGAAGVYKNADGSYSTSVTIDGQEYEISDGAWGCIAYSPITSLYEADMALAFEYFLNTEYSFKTSFQEKLAGYLSQAYMEYINEQELSVEESAVGFDLNGDGDMEDTCALTIEYDPENHGDTNGYYGAYLDLYMAEFIENLQWYLDNLDYAEGWTWFDEDGNALSDEEVSGMSGEEKAEAFLEGRYTKGTDGSMRGGTMPGGRPERELPGGGLPDGELPGGERPDGGLTDADNGGGDAADAQTGEEEAEDGKDHNMEMPGENLPDRNPKADSQELEVGTPDGGTTQSATGSLDSANYNSYEEMVAEYKADIEEIYAGDEYGRNIVSLYNPLNYIGDEGTEAPVWTKVIMGASEGDASLLNSLNLQIAWLNAGVDAELEWQWDGGHVPSEVLGDSFSLYVDQMYGEYIEGAAAVSKPEAVKQTENGTSEEASGTDISAWVDSEDISAVVFSLKDIAAYRTAGASKAMPGFDVIDYGQEDYVFGSPEKDARHWNIYLLDIFEKYAEELKPLFNQEN